MNNDLISREALKKELDNIKQTAYAIEDKQPLFEYVELPDLIKVIDNASTVDTTCPNCDSGYAQGHSEELYNED